jgi:uncharacterized iron-regulated protein
VSFKVRGVFAGFSFKYFMMQKGKKQEKLKQKKEAATNRAPDKPSSKRRDFLVDFLARFYKAKSSMALERKYIRHGKESISKLQMEMRQRMMDALHNPIWMDETLKSGYQSFMDKMVHDSIGMLKMY